MTTDREVVAALTGIKLDSLVHVEDEPETICLPSLITLDAGDAKTIIKALEVSGFRIVKYKYVDIGEG